MVDPARGSGHALGARCAASPAHLRTRVGKDGMDYKGYNIAVHEMGHNVEQIFSLNDIDHYAAARRAQHRVHRGAGLRLPGAATWNCSAWRKPDAREPSLQTLDDFWGAYEIAGVALVDMALWHWMYDHPDATPASCARPCCRIAKDVWNRYYAPVFGGRDVTLLGIYSHMIELRAVPARLPARPPDRLPDRGADATRRATSAPEFERVARFGAVTPDLWMRKPPARRWGRRRCSKRPIAR